MAYLDEKVTMMQGHVIINRTDLDADWAIPEISWSISDSRMPIGVHVRL
jgi:hypothetical protein